MPNPHDIKPGQTLWFVPRDSLPREVKVKAVGWITLGTGWRVDPETLAVDAAEFWGLGRCYLSRADHETNRYRVAAWARFRDAIRDQHTPPPGFGPSNLGAVWLALGWESEK